MLNSINLFRLQNLCRSTMNFGRSESKLAKAQIEVTPAATASPSGKPVQYAPFKSNLEEGKAYAWCSCGHSSKQPFCDGSHKKVNSTLNESALKYMPVRFKCIAPGEVYLCMCKSTKKGPFCDGTHKSIKPKEVQ